MDFVHEVGGVTDAHEWTPRINVFLPTIQFLIILERKVHTAIISLEQQAIRFEIGAFDFRDVLKLQLGGLSGSLPDSWVKRVGRDSICELTSFLWKDRI